MNSSYNIDTTQGSSNKVIAYRYRLDINDGDGFAERNFSTITEYFIPSSKICFNELIAFKSEKPRNINPSDFFHRRSEPLTAIELTQALINKIKNAVEKNTFNTLQQDEEYQFLFKIKPRHPVLVGNLTVFQKATFLENFKSKGNNVLKKALIQYILDGTTPKEIDLNEMIQLAKKLSPIEKESLVNSINRTLLLENGKLTEKRSKAIQDIENNHENQDVLTSGIVGGVGGAAISAVFRVSPIISIGLGFFGASVLQYADGVYKKYNENQLWDQREQRAKTIFEMINDKRDEKVYRA